MRWDGHEPSQEGKITVSRRRMVKALGAGASVVALGGLTGCTSGLTRLASSSPNSNPGSAQVIGLSADSFTRTRQILNHKLDHKGLDHALKTHERLLRMLLKTHRKGSANRGQQKKIERLVDEIKAVDHQIFSLFTQAGYWNAATEDWQAILKTGNDESLRHATNFVNETISSRLVSVHNKLGLSHSERRSVSAYYGNWAPSRFRDAVQEQGFESIWSEYIFDNRILQSQEDNGQVEAQQCTIGCAIVVHILIETAVQAVHSECANCNETAPTPPPDYPCDSSGETCAN